MVIYADCDGVNLVDAAAATVVALVAGSSLNNDDIISATAVCGSIVVTVVLKSPELAAIARAAIAQGRVSPIINGVAYPAVNYRDTTSTTAMPAQLGSNRLQPRPPSAPPGPPVFPYNNINPYQPLLPQRSPEAEEDDLGVAASAGDATEQPAGGKSLVVDEGVDASYIEYGYNAASPNLPCSQYTLDWRCEANGGCSWHDGKCADADANTAVDRSAEIADDVDVDDCGDEIIVGKGKKGKKGKKGGKKSKHGCAQRRKEKGKKVKKGKTGSKESMMATAIRPQLTRAETAFGAIAALVCFGVAAVGYVVRRKSRRNDYDAVPEVNEPLLMTI